MRDPIKITNAKIVNVLAAIRQIDALKKAPKGTYALAKNQNKLESALKPYETARQALWKECFGNDIEVGPDHPERKRFNEQARELEQIEVEINAHIFPVEDLNLNENPIRPSVLGDISVLLKDEDESKPEEKPESN